MITKRCITFWIFCCLSFCAHAQKDFNFLLNKPYEQRCRLIDSLFYPTTYPRDILALAKKLDQVSTLAEQAKDKELYLEVLHLKLRFATSQPAKGFIEKGLKELIQQAEKSNYLQVQIKAIDLYAWRCYLNNNVGASIEQYLNAYYLMRQLPAMQFPDKRDYLYNDLASIYYGLEDYDNAKALLLEANALPFYPVPLFIKTRGIINVNNTLGLIYRITTQYDSAVFYFKKAYAVASQAKDSAWVGVHAF